MHIHIMIFSVVLMGITCVSAAGSSLYPEPPIMPPAGHPRVYFTAEDIPKILANASKQQNALAWAKHESNLADTAVDAILPLKSGATTNYNSMVLGVIESRAFDFVLRGNIEAGQKAISAMRDYVNKVVYEPSDYNNTGQTIFTIAVVYDWCYPLLTSADKAFFADAVLSTAAKMEIGWPPTKGSAITGHSSEGQLMRDLLCAAIALYDERPDIYMTVAGRFFHEYVDPRKFMYAAHMHSQGDGYTSYRAQWEILATLIMDALNVPQVFGPEQQYILYWALYARRPDGQILRDGDSSFNNLPVGSYRTNYYRSMIHTGNYFNDPYLKGEGLRELPDHFNPYKNQSLNCVEYLIFNNPDLAGKPVSDLPLSKYFPSPKGGMIARTGWEEGVQSPAVVAEMKINEYYFGNHQHLDAGSFQIYYKGALATDSGYYQALIGSTGANNGTSGYGSQHDFNYNKRTIAHNAMLVFDPSESFGRWDNDGGQRFPNNGQTANTLDQLLNPANGYKVGEILGHEFGPDTLVPDYTYLKGDLTRAYSGKISDYERSFMFLNLKTDVHPAALIVFDRVVTVDENYKKTWLLHGLQEPTIIGTQTIFKDTRSGYNGKLTVDTLLPRADNVSIEAVGGPDKEFWVNGANYYAITTSNGSNEGGGWRLEISPIKAQKTDYFLHVLQVGEANPDMPPLPMTVIETDKVVGVQIADRVTVFAKAKNRTKEMVEFSFSGQGEFEITVADMAAGTWLVTRDGVEICRASASEEGGVVAFMGGAGNYRLDYVNDAVARHFVHLDLDLDFHFPGDEVNTIEVPVDIKLETDLDVQSIIVSLDDDIIWRGTASPTDLTVKTWELADGRHQLAVQLIDGRGFVYRRQSQFSVANTVIQTPAGSSIVHGIVPIHLQIRVPEAAIRSVVVTVNDMDGVAVKEIYRGVTPLHDLMLNTLDIKDGTYTLTATTTTVAGVVSAATQRITVNNWSILDDDLMPPIESAWFGSIKQLKTAGESSGWQFIADRPEIFFGDTNRMIRKSGTQADQYLIWGNPKLAKGTVTVYARWEDVTPYIELAVSADQATWLVIPYRTNVLGTSTEGWRKLVLAFEVPAGVEANYVRLTLTASDSAADDIQLGAVSLQRPAH